MKALYESDFWTPKRNRVWMCLSIIYLLALLALIVGGVYWKFRLDDQEDWVRVVVVLVCLVFYLAPLGYWWPITFAFEKWHREAKQEAAKIGDEGKRKSAEIALDSERNIFESNRDLARAFWTAVLVFVVAFLITVK